MSKKPNKTNAELAASVVDLQAQLSTLQDSVRALQATGPQDTEPSLLPGHGNATSDSACLNVGFSALDRFQGLLHPGKLTVLAAERGMGKTSLALNIALHVARSLQSKSATVLFRSTLESNTEITRRLLCMQAQVGYLGLERDDLHTEEYERLGQAAASLKSIPLRIDAGDSFCEKRLRKVMQNAYPGTSLQLLVVDDLPAWDIDDDGLQTLAVRLKALAKSLCIPVLCISSLDAQSDLFDEGEPALSGILNDDTLEPLADVILSLRPVPGTSVAEIEMGTDILEVTVEKNDLGDTGVAALEFYPSFGKFRDLSVRPDRLRGQRS